MKKKLFVLLMALLMVMTMMPTTAFAATKTKYVTLRPTTIGGTVGTAKVKAGDTVCSYNNNASYEVRSVDGTTITVWVYLDNLGRFFFPKSEQFMEQCKSS